MAHTDIAELLLGLVGVIILGGLMSAAPAAFEAMFRGPIHPGWPVGVQEDDDMRWSWPSDGTPREATARQAASDTSYEVRATRIQPRLSGYRVAAGPVDAVRDVVSGRRPEGDGSRTP